MNNGGRADYFKDEMNAHSMFPRRMTNASEIGAAIILSRMDNCSVDNPPTLRRKFCSLPRHHIHIDLVSSTNLQPFIYQLLTD